MKERGRLENGTLLVVTPVSSGDPLVGATAAETAAHGNTRVFYLVPQEALADEKFRELRQRHDKLRIMGVIPSPDLREHDDGIRGLDLPSAIQILGVVVDTGQRLVEGVYDPEFEPLLRRSEPPADSRYAPSPQSEPLMSVSDPLVHYTRIDPAPKEPVAPDLVVNLRTRKIFFRGCGIPTRPPHHIQWQPMLALAVLAQRAGEIVTMAEIADGMFKLGGLRKRPVTPDARDLRYKLQRPFVRAVAGSGFEEEIPQMFETVPGVGLRLNLVGTAEVIGRT